MSKSVLLIRPSAIKLPFRSRYFITGILLLLNCARSNAQGDLLISPLRVLFEGSKKTQEINLANVGKDTSTYAVSILDYRMKEDGSFEEIKVADSGQNFAGPFLRFFPRKVTLAPNEAQVVKIQLINTAKMTPGEYRSHLYFRAVPDERPLGEKASKKDSAGISIQLTPIFGITIPIIVRVGDNVTDVTLSDLALDATTDTAKLSFSFNRTGNMSVYGDVTVDYISPGGKSTRIKLVKGVGVYTPIPVRRLKLEIENERKIDFHKGKIHITYTQQMSDKTEKKTEAELELK